MQIVLSKRARGEIVFWKKKHSKLYRKVLILIENMRISPYSGVGKPEALKHDLSGYWCIVDLQDVDIKS